MKNGYATPDRFEHVYAFAFTVEEAERIALEANRLGVTRKGKFIADTFVVSNIPGCLPAVTGILEAK